MKPIEKGCLAVIVGGIRGVDIGKIVTVGKFIGEKPGHKAKDLWEVTPPLEFKNSCNGRKRLFPLCPEHCMQRIDDDEEESENDESRKVYQDVGVAGGNGRG